MRWDETKRLFETGRSLRFAAMARFARRKLDQLEHVTMLRSLAIPPGNRLEALAEDRIGQFSIRVNDQ